MSIKRSNLFSLRDNRIQFFSFAWNLSTDHKHFSPFATNNGPVFIIKTKCMCCKTGFKSWSWNMLSSLGDIIFLLPFSIFLQNPHAIAIWLMRRIIEVENCHFPQEASLSSHSHIEDYLTFITMVSRTPTHGPLDACREFSLPWGWVNSAYT